MHGRDAQAPPRRGGAAAARCRVCSNEELREAQEGGGGGEVVCGLAAGRELGDRGGVQGVGGPGAWSVAQEVERRDVEIGAGPVGLDEGLQAGCCEHDTREVVFFCFGANDAECIGERGPCARDDDRAGGVRGECVLEAALHDGVCEFGCRGVRLWDLRVPSGR